MTRAAFPELQRFFSGYLHEDFVEEHGTPEGALRAFVAEASDAERKRLREEAGRLLEIAEWEDFDELRARLAALGAKWAPRSRAALLKFLSALAAASG